MTTDRALPFTVGNENNPQNGFNIGVNRNIVIQYDPIQKIVRLDKKSDDGKYNSRRSLKLARDSWSLLCANLANIEKAVIRVEQEEAGILYKLHIGKLVFVTVESKYGCVDIRTWYMPRQNREDPSLDKLRCGIPGLALKFGEFRNVMRNEDEINDTLDIEQVEPCVFTHQNQEAAAECGLCNTLGLFY